ncbi:Pleiotropic regulator 1 [Phlyctochytrium bullatum]|nr:Pleiotropic regulator 1 [Phlyctochytrium bullatum]
MVELRTALKRTQDVFLANYSQELPVEHKSQRIKLASKIHDEWSHTKSAPASILSQAQKPKAPAPKKAVPTPPSDSDAPKAIVVETSNVQNIIESLDKAPAAAPTSSGALIIRESKQPEIDSSQSSLTALIRLKESRKIPKPQWHAPWKLMRIWDLASGTLKLTLTGHIATVRGLAVSPRHPYLFSCGEDKMIKCWDLEYNKVIRHYHGHLSGIYCLSLHPTLDVLVTGGRDSTARVWDMRTKTQIFALTGHNSTIADVKTQEADPQIITSSMDSTIRLWDLAAGKSMSVLTHHKKSVRAVAINPNEFTFVSASPDNIKQWKCPNGDFIQNLEGHNAIINTLAVNQDNVLFSGGDNGSMHFWDYKTGYNFQTAETMAQPGSLESENGVFCSTFDRTGLRLITGEADKTIKIWKEDENATEETHPINFKPKLSRLRF